MCIGRTDTDIRFDDDRIADFLDELFGVFEISGKVAAGGRYAGLSIEFLHVGFVLKVLDPVVFDARSDVEIGAQACILLQPVFVIGLEPVDLTIFEREKCHCTEYLSIVLKGIDFIIFCQGVL